MENPTLKHILDCIKLEENGTDIYERYQVVYDQLTLVPELSVIDRSDVRSVILTLDDLTYNGVDTYSYIRKMLNDKIKSGYRIYLTIKLPNNTRIYTGDELNDFIFAKNRKFYDKTLKLIQSLRLPIECVINDEMKGESLDLTGENTKFDVPLSPLNPVGFYILTGGIESERGRFVNEKLGGFVNMTRVSFGDPFIGNRISAIGTFINVSDTETDISKQDLDIAIRQTEVYVLVFTKLGVGEKHVDWKSSFSHLNSFLNLKKIQIYNF
jgi:hypothetical protein